jgi:cardiolipin synthase A/B
MRVDDRHLGVQKSRLIFVNLHPCCQQGHVEYRLQHYATLALYQPLLAAGVQIYEYQAGFLHAKVAVIDTHWATVGSSNIDPFSLWLAREANLRVQDANFAAHLRADLWRHIQQHAHAVPLENWGKRPFWQRVRNAICYQLLRWAAGGIKRGRDAL